MITNHVWRICRGERQSDCFSSQAHLSGTGSGAAFCPLQLSIIPRATTLGSVANLLDRID